MSPLIQALARSLGAQVIETHISWVLLAGADAYKIKKPVRLSFVDYSTLEARRFYCEEEVRLNSRLAPGLYLGVVPITGRAQAPRLGHGGGSSIEYAVHMRRFPEEALFSERVKHAPFDAQLVDALAERLAEFHRRASSELPDPGLGTPRRRHEAAFAALRGARDNLEPARAAQLEAWMQAEAATLAPLWQARRDSHRIRECHGDLHLANIVALDGEVIAFDAIEFDAALRWIDPIDDIAFAFMDFEARGCRPLAWRFLNRWLDVTGEHPGVPALRFAAVYRALVRAQVSRLRGDDAAANGYLEAALRWTDTPAPVLTITHGLPGSGKTFESQRLLERLGAVRLRSDIERKRIFGLGMLENSHLRGLDIYTADATARTYAALLDTARVLLRARHHVILDAAFLRRSERDSARRLAAECGARFAILHCEAPPDVLRARLRARQADASEANESVLESLRQGAQPLAEDELASACSA